ncbi:MAG: helix-turn-helix domain-containing protein [Pseudomonadota bacterium]
MDPIFKAMADPARRDILDALRDRDGQTLSELGSLFDMTRFGVMKHLGVLEEAGLVTSVKRGRYKHHYLNPLPLQEALDRWIAPLVKPATRSILDLKTQLEEPQTDIHLTSYIAAAPDEVWAALTSAPAQSAYNYMADTVTRMGDTLSYARSGRELLTIREVAAEPPRALHAEFAPAWAPNLPRSELTYRLSQEGPYTKLTLEHRGAGDPSIADGWARTLAGLKTFVETGAAPKFRAPSPAAPDPSRKETPHGRA